MSPDAHLPDVGVLLGVVTAVWQWRDRVAARTLTAQRRQTATDRRRLLHASTTSSRTR